MRLAGLLVGLMLIASNVQIFGATITQVHTVPLTISVSNPTGPYDFETGYFEPFDQAMGTLLGVHLQVRLLGLSGYIGAYQPREGELTRATVFVTSAGTIAGIDAFSYAISGSKDLEICVAPNVPCLDLADAAGGPFSNDLDLPAFAFIGIDPVRFETSLIVSWQFEGIDGGPSSAARYDYAGRAYPTGILTYTYDPVPEPSSFLLTATAAGGLTFAAGLRRLRRKGRARAGIGFVAVKG